MPEFGPWVENELADADADGAKVVVVKSGTSYRATGNAAGGPAILDAAGKVPLAQLPGGMLSISDGVLWIASTFGGLDDEQLYIWLSEDGIHWWGAGTIAYYTPPSGLHVRDPSIIRYDGWWYVVHTNLHGWTTTGHTFTIARSRDLVEWEHVTDVLLSSLNAQRVWAPEFFQDDDGQLYIFVAVSPDASGNTFDTYYLTPAADDLSAWSAPVDTNIPQGHIDTFPFRKPDDTTCYALAKNNDSGYIELLSATAWTGPWTTLKSGDWAGWGLGEGPAVVYLAEAELWRVYYDKVAGGQQGGIYYSDSSDDMATWSTPAPVEGMGTHNRHGTVRTLSSVDDIAAILRYTGQSAIYGNGWIAYIDGTLICWGTIAEADWAGVSEATENGLYYKTKTDIYYPIAFANTPAIVVSGDAAGIQLSRHSTWNESKDKFNHTIVYQTSGASLHTNWLAIGRWI